MRTFYIVATIRRSGRTATIKLELTARLEVEARSLSDAYKQVRALPELKHAYLRAE